MISSVPENLELFSVILKKSREEFEQRGSRDMEAALAESLNEFKKPESVEIEQAMKSSLDDYENKLTEENLLKIAMNSSLQQLVLFNFTFQESTENEIMEKIIKISKNEAPKQIHSETNNPIINMVEC